MNDIIKKLRDRKILNTDSLVQSTITKDWMGSPVDVQATLIVKELGGNHCICQEYREADGKAYKIKFLDSLINDAAFGLIISYPLFCSEREATQ